MLNINRWIKFKGKIYYYAGANDLYYNASSQYFYIVDSLGKVEKKVIAPEQMEHYYDLYIKNDSLFITDHEKSYTYYFDEKVGQWVDVKKSDHKVYEDDQFYVTTMDFGEFGGNTWFIDKSTKKQYELTIFSPIINKLNNAYYITKPFGVFKIDNPKDLQESKVPYSYEKMVVGQKIIYTNDDNLTKVKNIFRDTSYNLLTSDFYIITSFIMKNQLYHLYLEGEETKIGVIKNRAMHPIHNFKTNISPVIERRSFRGRITKNGSQRLSFTTKAENLMGILELGQDKIHITYLKNKYIKTEMGAKKAKEWFKKAFDEYFDNIGNMKIAQVDESEKKIKSDDLTQKHHMSTYLKPHLDLETPRIYRKDEDSIFSIYTEYFYTKKEKLVEIVTFNWKDNPMTKKDDFDFRTDLNNPNNIAFRKKQDWVKKYITSKIGPPCYEKQEALDWEVKWEVNDKVLILEGFRWEVELTMYRN